MGRASIIPEIEARIGKPCHKFFKEEVEKGTKPQEIGEMVGISRSQAYDLVKAFNLSATVKEVAKQHLLYGESGGLKDLIDSFLKAKEVGDRSEKTLLNYRDVLYAFLKWIADKGKPNSLVIFESPDHLREYMLYLKNEAIGHGKPLQASTRRLYYRVLRAFGYWLEAEEKIEKNPMKRIESPKVGKREPEDLPNEVVAGIYEGFDDSFEGIRNKAIIGVFLETGLRLDENVSLTIDQVNLETGWANIIGKGDKERKIKLSPFILEALKQYVELRNPIAKTDSLWIDINGQVFSRDGIRRMVHALNDKFPGHRIHPHLFRHVWARFMAESNVNLLAIAKMGGWTDLDLVQHYASAMSAEKAWEDYEHATPLNRVLKK